MWDDGTIWEGARQGKLVLRTCRACKTPCHPPLPMCPVCQSLDWDMKEASGNARLKSWLVSIRPDGGGEPPRLTVVVTLAEGPNFMSNLVNADIETLYEGMPLTLTFQSHEDQVLPVFQPAGPAA